MPRCVPPPGPVEPAELLAALLVEGGLAWPLARSLAPWVQAVDAARRGETPGLLETVRVSALTLAGWIAEGDASAMGLRDACAASLALIEALADQNECLLERRRMEAWMALQALGSNLRTAEPSPWARERGLSW